MPSSPRFVPRSSTSAGAGRSSSSAASPGTTRISGTSTGSGCDPTELFVTTNMNERNHWITFTNDDVVRWGAYLPAPLGDADKLIRFGLRAVDSGRRHAVWDVR